MTSMNIIALSLVAFASANIQATVPAQPSVSLTEAPLVMRLSKDEFRIAFGINGERCFPSGCHGLIRYRVKWKTEDGMTRFEIKRVNYAVLPHARRSITVDRQYFDTAESQHTTDLVSVSVNLITCDEGAGSTAF